MSQDLKDAFTRNALRCQYNGAPGVLLPVTPAIAETLNAGDARDKIGQTVQAGEMMVSWVDDGNRRGKVLNPNAGNNLTIMVARNDGEFTHIPASDITAAATQLTGMAKRDTREREEIAQRNDEARVAHDAAVARGEDVGEFEPAEPTFKDDAFDRVPGLVDCAEASLSATLNDPFADIADKSRALAARYTLSKEANEAVTPGEMVKITTERSLREEIGALNPEHPEALAPGARAYQGDSEAAREKVAALDLPGTGFNSAQMSALAGNPVLRREVFSVMTTTPVQDLTAKMLSGPEYHKVVQEMGRHEETDWAPQAFDRVRQVLSDRIPGYDFEARLFSRDEADVMLMRDHVGAYLYAWDRESRVAEIDLGDRILTTHSRDDVPSDERIHDLRVALQDLQYDPGTDIDFDFDDEDPDLEGDFEDNGLDM